MSKKDLDENIFVVVKLLLNAIDIIDDRQDRLHLAQLLLQAGEKAVSSTAFNRAFQFFNTAINLLSKDCDSWNEHYDLTLKLHEATTKVAICITNDDSMNKMIEEVSKHVTSTLHLIPSYSMLIRRNNQKLKHDEAIQSAANILAKLGININCKLSPSKILSVQDLVLSSHDTFLTMTAIEDARALSNMTILNEIFISTYYSNHDLYAVVSCLVSYSLSLTNSNNLFLDG